MTDKARLPLTTKSPYLFGLLCLLVSPLYGCGYPQTPAEVTQKFWAALQQDDISAAKNLATASSRRQIQTETGPDIKGTNLTLGEIRIDGPIASVNTFFRHPVPIEDGQHPSDLELTTYLVNVEGHWQVDYDKTTRLIPGRAFNELMKSFEKLAESYRERLEEQAPLIEEKIESFNEKMIEQLDEFNRQLEKQEKNEEQQQDGLKTL